MSGGVAYVYDPERRFASLCNVDVAQDLFPVEDGQVRMGGCGGGGELMIGRGGGGELMLRCQRSCLGLGRAG